MITVFVLNPSSKSERPVPVLTTTYSRKTKLIRERTNPTVLAIALIAYSLIGIAREDEDEIPITERSSYPNLNWPGSTRIYGFDFLCD